MAKETIPTMIEDGEESTAAKVKENTAAEKHWTEVLTDAYAEGCSDAEVIKICKITRKQFDEYMQNPKFAELVQRGRDYSEAWWMEQGRLAVKTRNNTFPQSLWFNCMQNKFNWNTKADSKNANLEASLNVDKLKDELRKKLPELQKMVNVIELDPVATRKVIRGE